MSHEDRPAAEGPVPRAASGLAPPPAASRSFARRLGRGADGLLPRARPLLAAAAGLALGLACGQWLISSLADKLPPAQAQAAAAEASAAGRANRPAEADASTAPADAREPAAAFKPDAAAEGARRRPPVNDEEARRKETKPAPAATTAGASRGVANVGAGAKGAGEPSGRRGVRCALSVSASSLSLRAGGGSGTVTAAVDELAGRGAVTASTKNWPDIAVFSESGGGRRGRYTIISTSRRPGTYAVTFQSPCGAKTLPVTVK